MVTRYRCVLLCELLCDFQVVILICRRVCDVPFCGPSRRKSKITCLKGYISSFTLLFSASRLFADAIES